MQNGKFSLLVRGDFLNREEIESQLNLCASSFSPKGMVVSKVIGANPFDVWVYDVPMMENESAEVALQRLLSLLTPGKEFLQKLSQSAEVYLKCYIQSELSQIQFDFSSTTLLELSSFKLKLNFSVFSWGKVEDETEE